MADTVPLEHLWLCHLLTSQWYIPLFLVPYIVAVLRLRLAGAGGEGISGTRTSLSCPTIPSCVRSGHHPSTASNADVQYRDVSRCPGTWCTISKPTNEKRGYEDADDLDGRLHTNSVRRVRYSDGVCVGCGVMCLLIPLVPRLFARSTV